MSTSVALPPSVTLTYEDEIALVRLSRPEKRNALNDTTVQGLETVFTSLPDEIKAVVLHGVFSLWGDGQAAVRVASLAASICRS